MPSFLTPTLGPLHSRDVYLERVPLQAKLSEVQQQKELTPNTMTTADNNTPVVSVIMTVLNGEAFLRESLEGILNQSFKDFELVINDNGSTDGTATILAETAALDTRVRVLSPIGGAGPSFGHGIKNAFNHSRGRFVAIQDADDISLPLRLQKQVTYLVHNPDVALIGTWVQWINDAGNYLHEMTPPTDRSALRASYLRCNPLAHSSIMMRRDLAEEVGGYDVPSFLICCDFALAIALLKADYEIGVVPETLVKMRTHQMQTSWHPSAAVTRTDEYLRLLECAQHLPNLSVADQTIGKRELSKARLNHVLSLCKAQRITDALGLAGRSFLKQPMFFLAYAVYRAFRRQR